eukprot:350888-Chlamydomonas_euryale.AAC.4
MRDRENKRHMRERERAYDTRGSFGRPTPHLSPAPVSVVRCKGRVFASALRSPRTVSFEGDGAGSVVAVVLVVLVLVSVLVLVLVLAAEAGEDYGPCMRPLPRPTPRWPR